MTKRKICPTIKNVPVCKAVYGTSDDEVQVRNKEDTQLHGSKDSAYGGPFIRDANPVSRMEITADNLGINDA